MLEESTEPLSTPAAPRSFRVRFAREAILFFVMKIGLVGLMFIISVFLTRTIGAEGFGIYVYATTVINLFVLPAVFGLDQLLVREVSAHLQAQDWGAIRGLVGWTNRTSVRISLGIVVGSALIAVLLAAAGGIEREMFWAFLVALVMLPFVALTRLRQGTLRGLFRIVPSQLPEAIIQPGLFLVLLSGLLVNGSSLNAVLATGLHVLSTVVAFFVGATLLVYYLPASTKTASPTYNIPAWRASAWPLLMYTSMQFMNKRVDTLLLGALDGVQAVGIYTAVVRSTDLLAFVVVAINSVLAPTIATLYKSGNMRRLQSVCNKSARVALLITVVMAIPLILFGRPFLTIFGSGFAAGQSVLNISVAARIMNTVFGMNALVLTMTGYEKDVVFGIGAGAALNVLLNVILIPGLGVVGAAIASTGGVLCWNVILTIRVAQRLGMDSTVLGLLTPKRREAVFTDEKA